MSENAFNAAAGSVLFRPGDPCPGLIRLQSGTIRVSLTSPGRREVVLYRVRPGELCLQTFSCLAEGVAYSAEGIAETDLSGTILPPAAFRRRLAEDAAFRDSVLAAIARRFHDFETLVEEVALSDFETRLARSLLRLAEAGAEIRVTHEALAAETASGRAFVSRRLADFAARGLIATARGRIRILDRDRLARIARPER